ncbi:MAG: CoA-binding protein [Chitinophagales bacterium]|nr:CoA-binding protein [Chitinophagales bacterium]MBP9220001.1 CoA-binding protein [Chitinophagales bacterium]MBP9796577.1 CoA-binding protein [Chitinophagales bacterium]
MVKKTLVLGASPNPERYGNMAARKLKAHGHEVVAVGKRESKIDDMPILKEFPLLENIDTVTLYLNPDNQKEYYEKIIALNPKRIIFNPGTENEELEDLAKEHNIETVEGCTLVMLSTGTF